MVSSAASAVMTGAVVSSTVNVAVVLLALPHMSVAVKVTVTEPVLPQSSLKAGAAGLMLHMTSPSQLSEAAAPPRPTNQLANAWLLLKSPAHSMVMS